MKIGDIIHKLRISWIHSDYYVCIACECNSLENVRSAYTFLNLISFDIAYFGKEYVKKHFEIL